MRDPWRPAVLASGLVAVAFTVLLAAPASAFDSKGHVVIEALAYRTLVEGRDGQPPRPDILRDLINDGALDPPWCFGRDGAPPRDCRDAMEKNPLLLWPKPEADRPDAFFRRQFSDPGQCFHFMGTLTDGLTDPLPGTPVPRALATAAVVRCNDLLGNLLRQIVVDGGPGTRRSGYGLYEMMHAVEDSFSGSHTARTPEGIDYLLVWKPIEKVARIPTERTSRIPDEAFHKWDDHRDKTFVIEGGAAHCETLVNHPYEVPYACLSPEGDHARQAIVELLVLVRDLRAVQLAAPPGTDTKPEQSETWRRYRTKWFSPVHACEGAECAARQPREVSLGRYAFLGLNTRYNPTSDSFDVAARGALLRYAEDLNPFVYALDASLGYRHQKSAGGSAFLGLGFDLALPVGYRASVGLTPAELRTVFGSSTAGAEVVTRLFRFDYALSEKLFLSAEAPLEVNWRRPRAEWSFAVGLSYGLSSTRLAGGDTLLHHEEEAERKDTAWVPPPAPYGRLKGRRGSLYAVSGVTVQSPPQITAEGRAYGLGTLGVEVIWDSNRWGGRLPFAPAASLLFGLRSTSGESAYFTGILGLGFRWYFLGPLGLAVTPVRVEGGPKIRGSGETDPSPGVHGTPGSEYYLEGGTRVGVAVRLGIFDLLVEGPTLAWSSDPFGAKEILSFRLGLRLH